MKKNKGSLVVVGSGIKSVGHITFETKGWIEEADLVAYCVADPATEVWIKEHSRDSRDLYTLYGNDKKRIDTYNDMVDVMLTNVRAGKKVCAVFYGHPGVFVHPGHRAIEILRSEGYRAWMLPAISALDCLFADLGVDPSLVGCQTYEATDMLMRDRPICTESHVIVWQIGCVGDMGFNFGGYSNGNLPILVEYLERFYSPDHIVTHYQGSQYPVCPPSIERLALRHLRTAPVTGISTLYLPPVSQRPFNRAMGVRLGLFRSVSPAAANRTAAPGVSDSSTTAQPDGASTNGHKPKRYAYYMPTLEQSGLAAYIAQMALYPRVLAAHLHNPEIASRLYADLTDYELRALLSRSAGRIRMAMKDRQPMSAILHAVHDADPNSPEAETLRTVPRPPAPRRKPGKANSQQTSSQK